MAQRTVSAAVIGLPNTGKSTLMNALLGCKIAITSPKPQTTRRRMMGVLTKGETQFMFYDTPGFHDPKTKLGEHMIKAVRDTVSGVDCAVFLTWPKAAFSEDEHKLLGVLKPQKTILCLNKSDTLKKKEKGLEFLKSLCGEFEFKKALLASAREGEGLEELLEAIESFAREGPHLYEDDALTDVPEREIAAELIRESLLAFLRDELPHGCAVSIESFREREGRDITDIEAEIVCEKSSHKGMIIGRGGVMLKNIGADARAKLEDFLGCRVNLKLWVKVREGWRDKESYIKALGF
ncbi:MAG: GTPase Era [Oscillospiraceae bacterium]|nr:GTPase Era [Oscillospiraceae bacterium]